MLSFLHAVAAYGGLGPAHVVVLYNADVPEAVAVAEAYAASRSLPPGHLCPLTGVDPEASTVDFATYDATIAAPFRACLDALPQPEEIDAIVTVRSLPMVVTLDAYVVGLEALLQVGAGTYLGDPIAGQPQEYSPQGYHLASVPNPTYVAEGFCDSADLTIDNLYGAAYRSACTIQGLGGLPRSHKRDRDHVYGGYDLTGELFVVARLDGFDHDDAMALVERGAAADAAFPGGEWLCMKGADEARSARDPECELTTRLLAATGEPGVWLPAFDGALTGHEVVGYLTGAADLKGSIDGVVYAPGALACNLTSFGAVPQNFVCDDAHTCPGSESQTSVARFVRAGATAVHGTVAEPLNNSFPDAGMLLLYQAGYSVGEAVLFSQEYLYWQNLLLGDPMTTPFSERPAVDVPVEVPEGGPLVVTASHPDGVSEVRLYLDGVRVADADGDTLEWTHDAAEGEVLDLLAVGIADHHRIARTGWPVPDQNVRANTQGWTTAAVTVGAPVEGPTPGDTGGGSDGDGGVQADAGAESGGCGCTVGSPAGPAAMLALGLGALLRRRRGPRTCLAMV